MVVAEIRSHRDLLVWQKAMTLSEAVYEATQAYPRVEEFGLTSQSRRAAVSIAANIAEGYGRGTRQAYVNFLRIARGSLKELETHLELGVRVRLLDKETAEPMLAHADELGRMLHGLISKVK